MRGDKILIEEHHRNAAAVIADRIAARVRDGDGRYTVTVAGESGSGKSETARALAEALGERYTKLFVFDEQGESNIYPSKARHGDRYVWGDNVELFRRLTAIRLTAEDLLGEIADADTRWLLPPDATTLRGTAVWTQQGAARYVFCANYDIESDSGYFGIPGLPAQVVLEAGLSTNDSVPQQDRRLTHNGYHHRVENLAAGEGRVYRVGR